MAAQGVLAQDIMSKKPIHIKEDDSLAFVMNIFERTRISGAPVVNGKGDYVGVISKTDLVGNKLMSYLGDFESAKAKDFMSSELPLMVGVEEPIEDVVSLMLDNQVHRIFVGDEQHKIVGVVSSFDILKVINQGLTGKSKAQAEKVAVEEKSDKEKELERRIFNLISMKQEQMAPKR